MQKKHIVIILGVLTVCFITGLLLFPQLKNGGEKSTGYALARTPAKTAVPVVVALAATEPFTESLEALGTASANESVVITPTLDDTTVIKLDFTVPETYLGVLRNGMEITAQSPAYPDRDFSGTVTAISSRVDPETRTLTVRARIPNPDRLLKPGMLLTVDLIKDRSQALIIPEEAVILEKDKKFALVVTADDTVAKKEIVTGRRSPGKVEVISGLNAGQRVIVKGISRVRLGVSVNVVETPQSPGLPG